MKRLCLAAFAVIAVFATGCKKTHDGTLQDGMSQTMQTKTETPDVQVINGRLVFSNIAACEEFAQTCANLSEFSLDSLEESMGYTSYRQSLGTDFYDESITVVESWVLGTVLNPDAIYQVGDSAFYVYKTDSSVKINMLSGVTEEGISMLKTGTTGQNIYDVTELDLYGDMAKSTNENCGQCRSPQQFKHVKKSDFTYLWQGQTRYVKGFTKYETLGALKTLFAQMKHYRGADILTPLPGNCRFFISCCGQYQYKIGNTCYKNSTDMYNPPKGWSGYSLPAHQITISQTSKCLRNFYAEAIFQFEYETSTSTTQLKNFGNYTWARGLSSCH